MLELARIYVERLAARIELIAATVVGSVARGDFNVWSDVDVVVVAPDLPSRVPDRGLLLAHDAPGRVQPVGFTPEEFARALDRRNPLAVEAITSGVALAGHGFIEAYRVRLAPARES